MKKITKIAVGIFVSALLLGLIIITNQNLIASTVISPVTQVENNKLQRNGLSMEITKIVFNEGTSKTSKYAEVYMTIENSQGKDKAMLPKGAISAMVGTSGKVYTIVTKDEANDIDYSLDVLYKRYKKMENDLAKKQNKVFEPGVFLVAPGASVDMSEENIAQVIYEDENGNKTNIPILGITPTTNKLTGTGK